MSAAGDDTIVSAYSIDQTTGALSSVGSLDVSSYDSNEYLEAAASTDTTLYVAGDDGTIYIAPIGSTGAPSSSFTELAVPSGGGVYALAVDASQKYLLASDDQGDLYVYSIGGNGGLTLKSSTVLNVLSGRNKGGLYQIAFSRGQKFIYAADWTNGVHALTFSNGATSELSSSPYTFGTTGYGFMSVQVDPSNQFVYAIGNGATGVFSWTRDSSTGALTDLARTTLSDSNGVPQSLTLTF